MSSSVEIVVAARDSPLSRAQVEEVQREMPHLILRPLFVKTQGDLDKTTSLRGLEKTDFFTREIDEMVLSGQCDWGIHSAKDLPDPLREGLKLLHLTKGVDPADVLVLREGEVLRRKMMVATSSVRREECVKEIIPDATFVDLRGTIGERLALLDAGKVDGVVIAEAALIRLKMTQRHRIRLPGPTAPLQGRLAIIGRMQ